MKFNVLTNISLTTTNRGPEMPPAIRIVMQFLNKHYSLHLEFYWRIYCVFDIIIIAVIYYRSLVKDVVVR